MTQTRDVLEVLREAFGADVVGAYQHGSAVLGGLRPHSDIDVFAVLRRSTTARERRTLVEELMGFSGERARHGPARPVELTLVVQSEVSPWRYPPNCEFQYGEWLRDDYERGATPSPTPSPDLAPLITMVRGADAPLLGPPPADVLPPVPPEDLRRALVAGVPELLDELETDTRNVLLTLARVWMTLATGTITSKDAAADWALERLAADERGPLAHARAVYLGAEEEAWDGLLPRLRGHAACVVREIERLATDAPPEAGPY
ncbi:aminoglycoside adenylyltransferase family protein [Streptomyces oceani]|uniref:Nucleotidyltransferase n=1 Tax=Streptomyces oceani TaxID=1075402 RepID=A0A1E7KJ08_9ACTN|nr:aminoglycoside adenylyltransferase family protein [Streptomyces oceani]OEV03891.1 nucleotidyltransferase [Streptomyces oceani]